MTSLTEGLIVRYRDYIGKIRFVCNNYVTLCIEEYDEKRRDVCILIYRGQWDEIQLFKQSEK